MYNPNDLPGRLRSRIRVIGSCWIWTGAVSLRGKGYGKIWFNRRNWMAHRLVYTILVEPVPDELTLDHLIESGLCMTTLCCNPKHLEPVTKSENFKRYLAKRYR